MKPPPPPTAELQLQFVIQRMEQMELDKQTVKAKVGAMQKDIEEEKMQKVQELYVHCADIGKQCETRELGSYCKSNSNAGETQGHRCKPEE